MNSFYFKSRKQIIYRVSGWKQDPYEFGKFFEFWISDTEFVDGGNEWEEFETKMKVEIEIVDLWFNNDLTI